VKKQSDDIHEIQAMIPEDINELEPVLLAAKKTGYTEMIAIDLYSCLKQKHMRRISIKYGMDEHESQETILRTCQDIISNYDDDKATKYGPLSRYVSIVIKCRAIDVLREREPLETPIIDAPTLDGETTNLEKLKDEMTSDIAEDLAYANVLRQYMAGRIDFAAQIILTNMRLERSFFRLPDKSLQKDERMNEKQLPSMRVCLTNEVLLFSAELLSVDWAVNKSRLAKAMDGGFVRHVMANPPANPLTLRALSSIQLREGCENLPIANKICAAYLKIPDATYCDHHQKYHRVVWQNSRKDLEKQLRE